MQCPHDDRNSLPICEHSPIEESTNVSPEYTNTSAEIISNFFISLSEYIQFLRDWSRRSPDDNSLSEGTINLFSPGPHVTGVQLGDVLEVAKFKEAVMVLNGLAKKFPMFSDQVPDLDNYLQKLRDLAAMADEQYKGIGTLEILDQRITHLQAIFALLPTSHPERTLSYIQLGSDLITRFQHTDELHDLELAISHYSESCLTGANKYVPVQGLARCLMMCSRRVHNVVDLDKAMEVLLETLSHMPTPHPYRHIFLSKLGFLMMERYERYSPSSIQNLQDAILYYRDALASCPETSNFEFAESIPSIITGLAFSLTKRHEKAGIEVNARDVVHLLQKFLVLNSSTSQEKKEHLFFVLAKLLSLASGQRYAEDMLSIIRQFIGLRPQSNLVHSIALYAFFTILLLQFHISENSEDLDEAIAVYRDIIILPPEESAMSPVESLRILAGLLTRRFGISGIKEDLEEAIAIYQNILESLSPGDKRYKTMEDYAELLVSRFEKHSLLDDLEEAILLYRTALTLVPDDEDYSADRFELHFGLARTLLLRIKKTGALEMYSTKCLSEAISYLRNALASTVNHVNYTEAKRFLGACLLARYDETFDPKDLNESAELSQDSEEQPNDNLTHLFDTLTLVQDIEEMQNPQELEEMIEMYRKSLSLQPFPHPKRPETLVYLGKALGSIFKVCGGKKQLDEAVLFLREAINISPKSIIALLTLVVVLFQKAQVEELSTKPYASEILTLLRQCLPLCPTSVDNRLKRFLEPLGKYINHDDLNLVDTDEMLREINLSLEMDPFERARNMAFRSGNSYTDMKDLDESIHYAREAAMCCPDDHPHRTAVFHDTASKLFTRYEALWKPEDLDEALHYYRKSTECSQPGSYFKSTYLRDLGKALIRKLDELEDIGEMFTMLSQISMLFRAGAMEAPSSPISARFQAAKVWALLADACGHESALEAYGQAIDFLPRLSSMGANVMTRQETFKIYKIDGLSRNAALFAIRIGRYDKAIEFLEAGCAVFWLQALQLRSPMDELRAKAPELEAKLSKISVELDRASMKVEAPYGPSNAEKKIVDEELFKLEELNDEWSRTMDSIHALEGFHNFLSPKKLSSLQQSIDCPVIFLIPNEEESHALVILADEVRHVELPSARYEKLQDLVAGLPGSKRKGGGRIRGVAFELRAEVGGEPIDNSAKLEHNERGGRPRHFQHIDIEDHIQHVLQTLWNDVGRPIAQALKLSMDCAPVKVCWCPTGIFSFLPIHAAGIYNTDMSSIESASDYFISSYTPTVGALTNDKSTIDTTEEFKMMVVIDPKNLPSTFHEMKAIEKHVFLDPLLKFGTRDSPALVESVASNLSTVSIAHFACHGKQLADQPLDSSLILEDGDLKISRIMEERMPNAALAFLCACETAMGDKDLPDEAMHLGATLLFSGFRGVVATMWSIDDKDGPVVADGFYAHLFKDDPKNPDTALAAEAVHNATARLRKQGVGFKRWVPFIHLGC